MRQKSELRPYQRGAIEFIKRVKRCALFVSPGLGKTGSALTAITEMIENLDCGMTLVVAPPRVAKKTWPDELKEWAHLKDVTYVVIDGSQKKRAELLRRPACFHMVSIENLPWLLTALGGKAPVLEKVDKETGEVIQEGDPGWKSPKRSPYSAIIIDESSKVKASSTNRWKALNKLAFIPGVEYFIELTGTPAPNNMHDLWAQIYLLDRGERLGSSITAFRSRWFESSYDGHGYEVKGDYVVKAIQDRISDIVFTLREEDYANLPPRMYNNIVIPMGDKLKEQYRSLERKYVIESITEDKTIKAMAGASVMNKLQQLCIAEGTEVLCKRGWVAIEHVIPGDRVWDGNAFVPTSGVIDNGIREVIECFGVAMTPDHLVLTAKGWREAEEAVLEGAERAHVGLPDGCNGDTEAAPGRAGRSRVYDLLDCGPQNRFVVRGSKGPLIVHNCNGTVYDEEKGEHEFHSLKIDALRDLVEETGGQPLLVTYTFKSDLRRLLKAFPQAKKFDDRPETQDAWNRGEIPILLVHPQAVAHGLNLQFGGNTVVWYGLTWSLELYIQLNKRLHRSGQAKPVMIHHLIVEGTVDEKILASLDGKNKTQDALLDALKQLIEKYTNG